jgi:hypothetical protein
MYTISATTTVHVAGEVPVPDVQTPAGPIPQLPADTGTGPGAGTGRAQGTGAIRRVSSRSHKSVKLQLTQISNLN